MNDQNPSKEGEPAPRSGYRVAWCTRGSMFDSYLTNGPYYVFKNWNSIIFNIGRNLSEIGSTFSQISSSTTAYVGTLFDFDLINKQPKIRKLP